MKLTLASRMNQIPPYLFAALDARRDAAAARGLDIIDLGIGDPDLPTPRFLVQALARAARDPATHGYPPYAGTAGLRQAVAQYYRRRFRVRLDPEREVVILIGSKEGIAHLPVALVERGDVVLVPDPGYPVYSMWTRFCGGRVHWMPLREEHGFFPDFRAIPRDVARRSKLAWLCYPNNPTSALASRAQFEQAIRFARRNNIVLANDNPYAEIYLGKQKPISMLSVPGAREVGVEFGSLSKTFNMCGWRLGWAVGNAEVIAALKRVKNNTDSGAFTALQRVGEQALQSDFAAVDQHRTIYRQRRDVVLQGLRAAGLAAPSPRATFYIWCPVPAGQTSEGFCTRVLEQTGVLITPGNGFGPAGEGYFRIALTRDKARLREAVERIASVEL